MVREERSPIGRIVSGLAILPNERMSPQVSSSRHKRSMLLRSGPSPMRISLEGICLRILSRHTKYIIHPFHFTEVGNVNDHLFAVRGVAFFLAMVAIMFMLFQVNEIGDNMDLFRDVKKFIGVSFQTFGNSSHRIALINGESDHRSKEASLPTRVISVPWSVVINGISIPCDARICLAIYAADAWGIA